MQSTMRERKKEEVKAKILKSAVDVINSMGWAQTTMKMIAQKADVSLRTLYNYFSSKESIVATYMQLTVQSEAEKSWPEILQLDNTYDRLLFICRRSAEWMKENIILTEVYVSDPRNYIFGHAKRGIPLSGLDKIVESVLEMGQEEGYITKCAPAKILTRQFMGIYHFSVLTWLSAPEQDLFSIFKEGLDLLCKGIKADTSASTEVVLGMFY